MKQVKSDIKQPVELMERKICLTTESILPSEKGHFFLDDSCGPKRPNNKTPSTFSSKDICDLLFTNTGLPKL